MAEDAKDMTKTITLMHITDNAGLKDSAFKPNLLFNCSSTKT